MFKLFPIDTLLRWSFFNRAAEAATQASANGPNGANLNKFLADGGVPSEADFSKLFSGIDLHGLCSVESDDIETLTG